MRAALDDDLNTAEFVAAVFELVRLANAAADAGELRQENVPPLTAVLADFDAVFDVMTDRDAPKVQRIVAWARAEGREQQIAAAAAAIAQSAAISDAEVERLVGEHVAARKARNFQHSDALRQQLAAAGVILENTKDGVRWRRK